MKSFYRKRENKGYTLAEVLLTVAILLVLMAIAVPAIFTIRKNLRQKALDRQKARAEQEKAAKKAAPGKAR